MVRSGSRRILFVNGIIEAEETYTSTINDSSNNLSLGRLGELSQDYFSGNITDLRIYKGIAKYTSNFTPPNQIYLT